MIAEFNLSGVADAPLFIVQDGPAIWRVRAHHRRDVVAQLNAKVPGWRRKGWTCKRAKYMRSHLMYDKRERREMRAHRKWIGQVQSPLAIHDCEVLP